jgi:hypothetical protein
MGSSWVSGGGGRIAGLTRMGASVTREWPAIRRCGHVRHSHVHEYSRAVHIDSEVTTGLSGGFIVNDAPSKSKVGDRHRHSRLADMNINAILLQLI